MEDLTVEELKKRIEEAELDAGLIYVYKDIIRRIEKKQNIYLAIGLIMTIILFLLVIIRTAFFII